MPSAYFYVVWVFELSCTSEKMPPKDMRCINVDKSLLHRTIVALSITSPNSISAITEQIWFIRKRGILDFLIMLLGSFLIAVDMAI